MDYSNRLYEIMAVAMIDPPAVGTKVAVTNWEHMPVTVSKVEYVREESRYKITLDWGEHGTSHVYNHDEGTIWRRELDIN